MNQTAEKIDDQEFEIDDELELDEYETEDQEDDPVDEDAIDDSESEDDDSEDDGEDEDEVLVSIDGETPPQDDDDKKAPEWVRELRKNHRETQRENRELKAKLEAVSGATQVAELGKKPTLEDCDYDTDEYDRKLATWYEKKRERDDQEAEAKAEQQRAEQQWQETLNDYGKKKSALKVRDFEDAEAYVQDNFSTTQQGMIIQGAENAALVFYALGKNPKKASELSAIKDPVKFAFAVAKLETQLKVTNRKAMTKPEKTIRGSGRVSGSVDSTLERLRAEASKTGDFSKVTAYRRKQQAKK